MFRLLLSLFLFLFLSLGEASAQAYTHSRIFWDTTSRRTVFTSGGYARIIQLQDGRLMAVCESGGIQIAFSSNQGGTWTGQKKIVTNTNNTPNCVPDLIQLQDGTIVVGYNPRPKEPYTEDRRFGIRCKRSTDNGRTWSDDIFVNDASYTFNDGCWEPAFLQLPSGELQLYFADEGPYTTNGDQQISLCRSFDGGQTWSQAQKISYRAGFRDGMPVPVLLKDQSQIVVAIEDNGWGYGDFFPTTVRTTLENNWNDYWVGASDKNRERALNLDFCPLATGGAPYLRVLPWGETVLSHQSPYENGGKIQMRVAVGDAQARDFRGVTTPFGQGGDNPQGLWNSLAVIDTGIVVAVSGIAGKIEMIKGYPTRLLQASYARPAIDGLQTRGEGYFLSDASQIKLGTQTGTRVTADFAYDLDSLYFVARVYTSSSTSVEGGSSAVTLLLDVAGSATAQPQTSSFKIQLQSDGSSQIIQGSGRMWRRQPEESFPLHFETQTFSTSYVVECALPWNALGLTTAPLGQRLCAAMEVSIDREGTLLTEAFPDANPQRPRTWMEFRLASLPVGIRSLPFAPTGRVGEGLFDLNGRSATYTRGLLICRQPDGTTRKILRK